MWSSEVLLECEIKRAEVSPYLLSYFTVYLARYIMIRANNDTNTAM